MTIEWPRHRLLHDRGGHNLVCQPQLAISGGQRQYLPGHPGKFFFSIGLGKQEPEGLHKTGRRYRFNNLAIQDCLGQPKSAHQIIRIGFKGAIWSEIVAMDRPVPILNCPLRRSDGFPERFGAGADIDLENMCAHAPFLFRD